MPPPFSHLQQLRDSRAFQSHHFPPRAFKTARVSSFRTTRQRISCFTHGCGLRDRCPVCRGGIAPFAQAEVTPQCVCVFCGFDLRCAAKRSVKAAARRLDRSLDDLCKAEMARGSPTLHERVARVLRAPVVAGVSAGSCLTNLPASARIRCYEQLVQRADDGWAAADAVAHDVDLPRPRQDEPG